MKCEFCGRDLRYDFELEIGVCELCLIYEPPPDENESDENSQKGQEKDK